jgi:ATP-dependent exoDNAse (exonuclease V) beta subunit
VSPFAETEADVLDVIYELDLVPEAHLEAKGWTGPALARITLRAMTLALQRSKRIDFSDMIYLPLRLNWTRGMFDLVCIDEAQDMNVGQLSLAVRVCKPAGRIAIVGDNRQAIYRFRGADTEGLDRLKKELNAQELGLTTTYRCPRKIVEYAQSLVPDLQAAPNAPEGSITSILATELHKQVQPGDFVLSRTNAPLTKACLSLIRQGIRARIVGRDIGQRLSNIAKRLRAIDVPAFYTRLGEWARREIDRAKKAKRNSRIQLICDQADTLRALLFGIDDLDKLFRRIEDLFGDPSAAVVMCSSVHRAKGLEADRVFVLQDTLYPGKWSKDKHEEQNIEYVAVTRAKSVLVWVNGFNPPKRFESVAPQPWEDERWVNPPWAEEDYSDDAPSEDASQAGIVKV